MWNPFRPFEWDSERHAPQLQLEDGPDEAGEAPSTGNRDSFSGTPDPGQPQSFIYKYITRVEPATPFTVTNQLQRVFLRAPVSLLTLFVPAGIVVHAVTGGTVATFVLNYLGALPLFALAEAGMEEISLRIGEISGGLLYLATWCAHIAHKSSAVWWLTPS